MLGLPSACLVGLTVLSAVTQSRPADLDARLAAIYEAAYSLDHDVALAGARATVAAAPGESSAHRALAGMLWLDLIFRRGTVTVDHFVGGLGESARNLPKPAPAVDAEFKQTIQRAIDLASERSRGESERPPVAIRARIRVWVAGLLPGNGGGQHDVGPHVSPERLQRAGGGPEPRSEAIGCRRRRGNLSLRGLGAGPTLADVRVHCRLSAAARKKGSGCSRRPLRDPDLVSRHEQRSSSFTAARGVMRTRTGCSASSSPPTRATGCSSWSRGRRPFVPASTPRRRPS